MLDPFTPDVFANPNASAFDFYGKKVIEIPFNPAIFLKINRARFINCSLEQMPRGLDRYCVILTLDFTDNFISKVDKKSFSEFCCLENLILTSNCITNFKVDLKQSLKLLDLSYNKGLNVKDVWSLNCPHLEIIKITHCVISELPDSPPKWSSSIIQIFLDGNFLTDIPQYFSEFAKLEEISLFGNRIREIRFSGEKPLKSLSLSCNYIESWELQNPLSVMNLNLSYNMFHEFPVHVLDTRSLRILSLSHCEISGCFDFSFPETISAFDISHNSITSLGANFISSLTKLSSLKASNNKISTIADAFPERCPLSQLFLDFNDLETLPPSFSNVSSLDTLSIKNNKLRDVSMLNFTRLRTINLSFNKIEELPDVFGNCSFLSEFIVSFNLLKELPKSLSSCKKIVDFNASGNMFSSFPRCSIAFTQLRALVFCENNIAAVPLSFSTLFYLQVLDLSCNNIRVVPAFISQLQNLDILSFAHNKITRFEDDFMIPANASVVDFSYNEIENFDFGIPSPNVHSLNLDCNKITSFNSANFPNLKFLSLNNNPLQRPFAPLITSLSMMKSLDSVEMLNCGKLEGEVPPLRYHLMTDSHVSAGKRFGVGYASTMGIRKTMEDVVLLSTFKDDQTIFSLFDGHQGNVSASISSIILCNELRGLLESRCTAFESSFGKIFSTINEKLRKFNVFDGCTAVSVFINGDDCYAVSVGDSRIVRIKEKGEERVTTDFKPMMRNEYERLISGGLPVSSDGRIDRKLAVSRTIGDFWCITDRNNASDNQTPLFVEPDVKKFHIEEDDYALIIACDGIWDVISDAWAAKIVRESKSPQDAATRLRSTALSQGSNDNISVIVLFLHPKEEQKGLAYKNEVEEVNPTAEDLAFDAEYEMILQQSATKPKIRRR